MRSTATRLSTCFGRTPNRTAARSSTLRKRSSRATCSFYRTRQRRWSRSSLSCRPWLLLLEAKWCRGALHPGARTAWHKHPHGQTLWVFQGVGLCQRRADRLEVIRPGDRVFFEPDEEHWHGAMPNRFMAHIAMEQVDDEGSAATWGDHVTDEEYSAAPEVGG